MKAGKLSPVEGPSSYLLKRHTSEGSNRRRVLLGYEVPEDLQGLTDDELDDRNARVWAVVLADCQRIAEAPVTIQPHLQGPHAPASRLAIRAACVVAHDEYGIPVSRIAELSERFPGRIAEWSREHRPDVMRIVEAWQVDGPEHVRRSADERTVDVPAPVYDELESRARLTGKTIGQVIADLLASPLH